MYTKNASEKCSKYNSEVTPKMTKFCHDVYFRLCHPHVCLMSDISPLLNVLVDFCMYNVLCAHAVA